jgi:UDP-N-acetylmuramate dehydrogenase
LSPRRQLQQVLEALCPGRVKIREPLAPLTTWKIGGKADWLVAPKDAIEMQHLLAVGRDYRMPCHFLGAGSNILVGDRGVRGIVIHLTPFLSWIKPRKRSGRIVSLEIGAGTPLSTVIRYGVKQSLAGLEFLVGIPGSLGGAWALNAGSHGREMKDLTCELTLIDSADRLVKRPRKALDFGYRRLALNPGEVIVSGLLRVTPGDREDIARRLRTLVEKRRTSQPWQSPSCGSVFKNPPGEFAGQLIEAAGLKGRLQGGAQVSSRHANFIINHGQAQARDVLRLMRVIRQRVQRQSGILLEPEVRFWGCSLNPRRRVPKVIQE